MSPLLREYLNIEAAMLALDNLDERLADRVRDAMDPLWHRLSAEDREWLNSRDLRWDATNGSISLPLSPQVVCAPRPVAPSAVPEGPIDDWRMVA